MGSANIKTLNLKKYKKINILESAVFLEQEIGALFVFVTRMAGFVSLRPEQIQITQPYRQATRFSYPPQRCSDTTHSDQVLGCSRQIEPRH